MPTKGKRPAVGGRPPKQDDDHRAAITLPITQTDKRRQLIGAAPSSLKISEHRPIFIVRLRAERGIDAIRALRALLKTALRRFGLRAVSLDAEAEAAMSFAIGPLARGSIASPDKSAEGQDTMRKPSSYVKKYLKVADVQDGPLIMHIAEVKDGSYEKPDIVFESGEILGSVSDTNIITLIKAYGDDFANFVGKKVELRLGQLEYKKEMVDAILIKPITPGLSDEAKADAVVKSAAVKDKTNRGDMDDDIPFEQGAGRARR
jgi:hypothetical protein